MAKKDITIEGVKKAKIELEKSIMGLLKAFEDEYEVGLGSYINIKRNEDLKTIEADVIKEDVESRSIKDVDIDLNIDVL
jgi:hypothetical protein